MALKKVTHAGKEFVFSGDLPGRVSYFHKKGKFYELRMLDYIRQLKIPGTYIDVGANVGNHTIYFAGLCNADKVIAIEPIPDVYNLLVENINLNKKYSKKIKTVNAAASSKKGTLGLTYELRERGSITVTSFEKKSTNVIAVTLDDLVSENPSKVGVIKIDVEGFEKYVLEGAKKILAGDKPELFIEAHTRAEKSAIEELLQPFGYKPIKVFNASPTYHYTCKDASDLDRLLLSIKRFRVFRRA